MINITEKKSSRRRALARGAIRLKPATLRAILERRIKKGDVFECARVAATCAVKDTPRLIPYCHNIPVTAVRVSFDVDERAGKLSCACEVESTAQTGVEMEALVGACRDSTQIHKS
jgi:cyclic pyranopterin phosphate synthase